jgi:hypothetical protein
MAILIFRYTSRMFLIHSHPTVLVDIIWLLSRDVRQELFPLQDSQLAINSVCRGEFDNIYD